MKSRMFIWYYFFKIGIHHLSRDLVTAVRNYNTLYYLYISLFICTLRTLILLISTKSHKRLKKLHAGFFNGPDKVSKRAGSGPWAGFCPPLHYMKWFNACYKNFDRRFDLYWEGANFVHCVPTPTPTPTPTPPLPL